MKKLVLLLVVALVAALAVCPAFAGRNDGPKVNFSYTGGNAAAGGLAVGSKVISASYSNVDVSRRGTTAGAGNFSAAAGCGFAGTYSTSSAGVVNVSTANNIR